jgi:ribosome-binding protein aMBF1 (putative translation factor)
MQTTEPEVSAREQRRIRDVAFAKLLYESKPENQLKNEMIQARKRAGLTQKELALRMRTHQSSVARLENGRSSPTVKTLRKLAQVTDCRLILRLDGPMRS